MIVYKKNNDAKIILQGDIESEIQYCNSIFIANNIKAQELETNQFASGSFLFSRSFGSCQAVVAKLNNGAFAIFHAGSAFEGKALRNFTKSIMGKVKEIYIFQKYSPPHNVNLKRAPFLAISLQNKLGPQVAVKRLHVNSYTIILADAKNNRVILANKLELIDPEEINNLKLPPIASGIPVNKHYAISIDDSIRTVLEQNPNYPMAPSLTAKKAKIKLIFEIKYLIEILKKTSPNKEIELNRVLQKIEIESALDKSLREILRIACSRRKSWLFHPRATTTSGKKIKNLLKNSFYLPTVRELLIKNKYCDLNQEIRYRDLRAFAAGVEPSNQKLSALFNKNGSQNIFTKLHKAILSLFLSLEDFVSLLQTMF